MKNIVTALKRIAIILIPLGIIGTVMGVSLPMSIPVLKAPIEDIIGNVERNGIVKYAYKSHLIPFAENEVSRGQSFRKFEIARNSEFVTYRLEIIGGSPQYYQDRNGWWQIDYATTTKEYFNDRTVSFNLIQKAFATTTPLLYPSIDGRIRRTGVDENFAAITTSAGNDSSESLNNCDTGLGSSGTNDQYVNVVRCLVNWDTSEVGAGSIIVSSTMILYGESKNNGLGSPDFYIASSTPASTSSIVNADYGTLSFTPNPIFASTSFAGFNTSATNSFILNSTGRDYINKEGITTFGMSLSWDFDRSFGGTWTSSANSFIAFSMSERAGVTQDPTLVIEFETPVNNLGGIRMGFNF